MVCEKDLYIKDWKKKTIKKYKLKQVYNKDKDYKIKFRILTEILNTGNSGRILLTFNYKFQVFFYFWWKI